MKIIKQRRNISKMDEIMSKMATRLHPSYSSFSPDRTNNGNDKQSNCTGIFSLYLLNNEEKQVDFEADTKRNMSGHNYEKQHQSNE